MKKKRIGLLALVLILLFSTTALAAPKLAKKKVTLKTGNAYVLKLSGNKKSVKWTTSDKSVVQIVWKCKNRAVLRAKQEGTSTVTAKIGKKKLTCQVTVKKSPAFPSSRKVIVGDKFTLSTKKKGNWSITSGIVRLSAKKAKKVTVTATAPGTAVIKVKMGKKTYKCKLTVITKKGTIPTPATGGGSTSTGGTTSGGTTGGSTGTTTGESTGTTTGGSAKTGTVDFSEVNLWAGSVEYSDRSFINLEAGHSVTLKIDPVLYDYDMNVLSISKYKKYYDAMLKDHLVIEYDSNLVKVERHDYYTLKITGKSVGEANEAVTIHFEDKYSTGSTDSISMRVTENLDDYRAYKKEIEDAREKGWKKLMSDMGITGTDLIEDMVRACRYVSANYNYLGDFSYYSERKDWTGQEAIFNMVDCFVRPDGYSDRVFGAGGNCISSTNLICHIIRDKYGLEPKAVLKDPWDTSTDHTVCQVEYRGVTYLIDCGYSGKAGYRLWDVNIGKSGEYTSLVAGTGNKIGTDRR